MSTALALVAIVAMLGGGYAWCENLIKASKKRWAFVVALAASSILGVAGVVASYSIFVAFSWTFAAACVMWARAWVGTAKAGDDVRRGWTAFRRWLDGN